MSITILCDLYFVVEIVCAIPQSKAHMRSSPSKAVYRSDDSIKFTCSSGYKLMGSRTLRCDDQGEWNNPTPKCEEIKCSNPPNISNGTPMLELGANVSINIYVKYQCGEGYLPKGRGRIKCREDGSWTQPVPVCGINTCIKPNKIMNGDFDALQSDELEMYGFGTVVSYTCSAGYILSGNATICCTADGLWNASFPMCDPIKCSAPDVIENGIIEGDVYIFKHSIQYTCDTGFLLKGASERICLANGTWSGSALKCEPVNCGIPKDIKHALVKGEMYTFGEIIIFICKAGYILNGFEMRLCRENGKWEEPFPTCKPVNCPIPARISNGHVIGTMYTYTSAIEYTCDSGYHLSENKKRICLANATWTGNKPICKRVKCKDPPIPKQGKLASTLSEYEPGSVISYSCGKGYELYGKQGRTCREDGTWSGPMPKCNSIQCHSLGKINHGFVRTDSVIYGSTAEYVCEEGYQLDGPETRTCSGDKQWSGSEPSCGAIVCLTPENIVYGTFGGNSYNAGQSVVYKCQPGYILKGESVRTCLTNRTWSVDAPWCKPIECDKPSFVISNGRMVSNNFSYAAMINYVCDIGYHIDGSASRTCASDGQWDSPIPVCERVVCPRPFRPPNCNIDGFDYHYKKVLMYHCRDGFELIGPSQRQCQSDRTWSGEEPNCIRVQCPEPTPLKHGKIVMQGLFYKYKAKYICDAGYYLVGDEQRDCGKDKKWIGEDRTCDKVKCGIPPTFHNALPLDDELEYGDKASYQCQSGYVLDIPVDITCTMNGNFTGEKPNCVRTTCLNPPEIENGIVTQEGDSLGDVLRYSCKIGYELVGNSTRSCGHDGKWNGASPTCHVIICKEPLSIAHGNITAIHGYTFGNEIKYSCKEGYELLGISSRICTSDKTWTNEQPECEAIECPRPDVPFGYVAVSIGINEHMEHIKLLDKFTAGMIIEIECERGYILVGSNEMRCLTNRTWLPLPPVCEPVKCPQLSIPHSVIRARYLTYGQRAMISCEEGYQLKGTDELQCGVDGHWSKLLPKCQLITCPPPKFTNGNVTVVESPVVAMPGYPYGITLKYACHLGFWLKGVNILTCNVNGFWSSGVPKCEPTYCTRPDIKSVQYLIIKPVHYEYSYKKKIIFSCKGDYEIDGVSEIVCEHGGIWSGAVPSCIRKQCPYIDFPNGRIFTAVSSSPSRFLTGVQINFACNRGWKLEGPSTSQCQTNKEWSSQVPSCLKVTCPEPKADNVILMTSFESHTRYVYGITVTLQCKEGYTLNGHSKITCTGDGTWSQILPSCVKILCPPVTVRNGHTSIMSDNANPEFGDNITAHCESGYELLGNSQMICRADGTWTVNAPTCQPVVCTLPIIKYGSIDKGRGDIPEIKSFVYKDSVRFRCNNGYQMVGSIASVCNENAIWAPPLPKCLIVQCPMLTISNGNISTSNRTYTSVVSVQCDVGHELVSKSDMLTCSADGQWHGSIPTCTLIKCPPPSIEHGSVRPKFSQYPSLFTYKESVILECHDGWELIGEHMLECQADKQWSAMTPYCQLVSCVTFPNIDNAVMEYPDEVNIDPKNLTYGSILEVSCKAGHELDGDSRFTCGPDGSWSGTMPRCQKVNCLTPQLQNGIISNVYGKTDNFTFNDKILFECNVRFKHIGPLSSICNKNGTWSEQYPRCVQTSCPLPNAPHRITKGTPRGKGGLYTFKDSVQFLCDHGYKIDNGESEVLCLEDGTWLGKIPECVRLECPAPTIENGIIIGDTFKYEDSIEYRCNIGFELVGPVNVFCQADKTWTLKSYCRPIRCSLPYKIPNGNYYSTGRYKYKSKTYYSCKPGYILNGHAERTCLSNKTWSGTLPSCDRIQCQYPVAPTHGQIIGSSFLFGDVIKFDCDVGYHLHGDKSARCHVNQQWSSQTPECEITSCGIPDRVPHSTFEISGENYGDVVHYKCDLGYKLHGSSKRKCSKRGLWKNAIPNCKPIICEDPYSITNGFITDKGRHFGSIIEYSCKTGFELHGNISRECLADKTWSGHLPTCDIIDCQIPKNISHGYIVGTESTFGSIIEYICDYGYELKGPFTRICEDNKMWTDILPQCRKVSCPTPKKVQNGYFIGSDYTFGTKITYVCNKNYTLVGDAHRYCLADMMWSGITPLCKLKTCERPTIQQHGRMLNDNVELGPGTSVTFKCDQGYQLIGEATLVCQDGERWHGEVPVCDKVSCGPHKHIENGQVDDKSNTYSDIVRYSCVKGYVLNGDPTVTCLANGKWSPVQVTCDPVSCGPPPKAQNSFRSGNNYHYGGYVYYACNEGYDMEGANVLKCAADGRWKGNLPHCTMVTCGHVPAIHRASTIVQQTTYGSKATYYCNRGYKLIGNAMIECMSNGTWMYQKKPSCVPVNCGPPHNITNGWVVYPDTTLGNIAKYFCSAGFRMSPVVFSVQCDPEGKWNGSAPQCLPGSCHIPPRPKGGDYTGDSRVNSSIIYTCNKGHLLQGKSKLTCKPDGSWSSPPPKCKCKYR